jgi:hypothetical protein
MLFDSKFIDITTELIGIASVAGLRRLLAFFGAILAIIAVLITWYEVGVEGTGSHITVGPFHECLHIGGVRSCWYFKPTVVGFL